MSNEQKNLFESFEELQNIEADGPAPAVEANELEPSIGADAPAPVLEPSPFEEPERPVDEFDAWPRKTGSWRRRASMAGLFVVVFGAGALVGRGFSEEQIVLVREVVQKSETLPADGALPAVSAPPPGKAAAAAEVPLPAVAEHKPVPPFAAAESALFDSQNEFTVRVITYTSTRSNEDLARKTAHHFQAKGLPVGRPHERGGKIYIVIGAAPSVEELHPLRDRVRGVVDPSGRPNQYASAFIDRIDKVVAWRGN